MSEDSLDKVIGHPTRRRIIEATWHSSVPLTARRLYIDYDVADGSEASLAGIAYHLGVLESNGVLDALAEKHAGGELERPFVHGRGTNAAEAIRRLRLRDESQP